MRLILFDIDGTLMNCGRQVAQVFTSALREVYGTHGDVASYSFAGRTDPGIVLDLMSASGIPQSAVLERLPRMQRLYLERLGDQLEPSKMRLLPGVRDLLDRLASKDDLTLGLLTGNWSQGARVKLSKFDLNGYFPFGAFGDDGFDRRDLVPAALARAEEATGRRFEVDEVLIVGDSVLDVDCGRAHGVPVLAVATGLTPASALETAGATWVTPDLPSAGAYVPQFAV